MRESNMDKVRSQVRWLLIILGIAAILSSSSSPGYALDVTLQWDANAEPDVVKYKVYYVPRASGNRVLGNYEGNKGAAEGRSPVDVPLAADEIVAAFSSSPLLPTILILTPG